MKKSCAILVCMLFLVVFTVQSKSDIVKDLNWADHDISNPVLDGRNRIISSIPSLTSYFLNI